MKAHEIKKGIYWVGGIDWKLRNFHGYSTERGSTYNAYLIIDEKITLVDTVKHYLYDEMLARIKSIIDPAKIDYVVCNHVEMDHSGSLPFILKEASNATVIISPLGEKGIKKHFTIDVPLKVIETGETVSIGKRSLQFITTQMVHWPDSMATYIAEEKLLLPNDAFGQHIASDERFDDEIDHDILMHEATKYYANIVLSYGKQVQKFLQAASSLDIDMIAPSHGLIYRTHINEIVGLYDTWSKNECEEKAIIIYDTMWESTEKMACALRDLFEELNIQCELKNLSVEHISDVITSLISAKYICVGSPTLNNEMLPTVAGFLTYLKGLAPKNRIGIAFGSYGWGGQSVQKIEEILEASKFDIPVRGLRIQYIPQEKDLQEFKEKVKTALSTTVKSGGTN